MSTKKIIDQYTDLPVSRQRKHQLRNPEWRRAIQLKYSRTAKAKARLKKWNEAHPTYYRDWQRNKRNSVKSIDNTAEVE